MPGAHCVTSNNPHNLSFSLLGGFNRGGSNRGGSNREPLIETVSQLKGFVRFTLCVIVTRKDLQLFGETVWHSCLIQQCHTEVWYKTVIQDCDTELWYWTVIHRRNHRPRHQSNREPDTQAVSNAQSFDSGIRKDKLSIKFFKKFKNRKPISHFFRLYSSNSLL